MISLLHVCSDLPMQEGSLSGGDMRSLFRLIAAKI